MQSLLKYIGKKDNIDIVEYIKYTDTDINTYCEPFGGGFSAGLNLLEKGFKGKVILNDLDTRVHNFWKCLQNDWEKLYNIIQEILELTHREEFTDDRIYILKQYMNSQDTYKRAASEYVYRKMLTMRGLSFKGKIRDTEIDFYIQHETIKNIEITNLGYNEVFRKYDSEQTFWLIDPPYDIVGVNAFYRCDSELFYHRGLREDIRKLKGKQLITYNSSDYIANLYSDYYLQHIEREFCGTYFEYYFNNFKELKNETWEEQENEQTD